MSGDNRILVTGATGFIGARLVEKLARRGKRIRIVTSDFRHCPRVARFPVDLARGDLKEPDAFARTAEGCDTIFHLAYRFGGTAAEQREVNIEGTRALAEAAIAHGIRRFVHFSSVAAYGPPPDGMLTENTPPQRAPDSYSDSKQRVDEMLRDLRTRRGLPLTTIQPTIVYGPYGYAWTTRLLAQVTSGPVILPARGEGLCNAVYVDDVVDAAILASESDAALGEAFLISGAAPVTWREFYAAYEQMAGRQAVVPVDEAELRGVRRQLNASSGLLRRLRNAVARRPDVRERLLELPPQRWFVRAGQALLPATVQHRVVRWYDGLWEVPARPPAAYVPDPFTLALYAAKTHVRIDKAREKLGFFPAFDLPRGMAKTALWAKWANLLPG